MKAPTNNPLVYQHLRKMEDPPKIKVIAVCKDLQLAIVAINNKEKYFKSAFS